MTTDLPPSHDHDDDPTGVRALLSSLPDPGPMPDDLVLRISAALDAEEEARIAPPIAPSAANPSTLADVVPLSGARRVTDHGSRRWWPAVAAAAGLLVVGGTGVAVLSHLGDHASSSASAVLDTAGSSSSAAAAPTPSTASTAADGSRAAAAGVQIRLSSRHVPVKQLAAYGAALLTSEWDPATPHTVEQPSVGPIGTSAGLYDCLASLHVEPGDRVAAEIGYLDARRAVIVATQDARGVRTYAAALPCTGEQAHLLAGPVTVGH